MLFPRVGTQSAFSYQPLIGDRVGGGGMIIRNFFHSFHREVPRIKRLALLHHSAIIFVIRYILFLVPYVCICFYKFYCLINILCVCVCVWE